LLPVTRPIVERYGIVRAELAARGLAKSDFDLLIACTALEHGATLVTNDGALKDGAIAGLVVEDWLS
jgi:predicted nucleic acid-binding protein